MTPPDAQDRLVTLLTDAMRQAVFTEENGWPLSAVGLRALCDRLTQVLLADPRPLLAAALARDEGKAALAEALNAHTGPGWLPGTYTTDWVGKSQEWAIRNAVRAIAAELAKETAA